MNHHADVSGAVAKHAIEQVVAVVFLVIEWVGGTTYRQDNACWPVVVVDVNAARSTVERLECDLPPDIPCHSYLINSSYNFLAVGNAITPNTSTATAITHAPE